MNDDAPVEVRDLSSGPEHAVLAISHLLDSEAKVDATQRFLADSGHHLLVAYDHDVAVGFVTGVEMTHPDKGTEMFLYELAVDPSVQGRGVGRTLVTALAEVAKELGCYGMWVLTDQDNAAAIRTYEAAGATEPAAVSLMIAWTFDDHEPRGG